MARHRWTLLETRAAGGTGHLVWQCDKCQTKVRGRFDNGPHKPHRETWVFADGSTTIFFPYAPRPACPVSTVPAPTVRAPADTVVRVRTGEKRRRLRKAMPIDEPPVDEATMVALQEGRPLTRQDCVDGLRPCPWVSCRHNLLVDVTPMGLVVINRPDVELHDIKDSCALDVADQARGGDEVTLEQIAQMFGVTRERVRQIEAKALKKVRTSELGIGKLD